jgi:hypothetical protein
LSGLLAATATFMPSRENRRAQLELIPGPPPTIRATSVLIIVFSSSFYWHWSSFAATRQF